MFEYEKYSRSQIPQTNNWYENNSEIRWHANCVDNFSDEKITKFYLSDTYARETRWNFWNNVVKSFQKHNIKSNLDIGCANNHFSYLCNKSNIFSVGIDPRENCVKSSDALFKKEFNHTYGYVGTILTFNEYFKNHTQILFDCVSILNFLHGNGHIPIEIDELFKTISRISKYTIITEPKWTELNIPKYTDNYEVITTINEHILYRVTNENS